MPFMGSWVDFHLAKGMFPASPPRPTNACFGSFEGELLGQGYYRRAKKGNWRAETSGVRDCPVALRKKGAALAGWARWLGASPLKLEALLVGWLSANSSSVSN